MEHYDPAIHGEPIPASSITEEIQALADGATLVLRPERGDWERMRHHYKMTLWRHHEQRLRTRRLDSNAYTFKVWAERPTV